jgi:hypothetical protein
VLSFQPEIHTKPIFLITICDEEEKKQSQSSSGISPCKQREKNKMVVVLLKNKFSFAYKIRSYNAVEKK